MKKILLAILLCPLFSIAQRMIPTYSNDTLYCKNGYKIYKGQKLQFGKGVGKNGKFRYVNIKSETTFKSLTNNVVTVTQLKNFGISSLGNAYIEVIGSIIFKDGSKGYIDVHMAFEKAMEGTVETPAELIVPDEFRNKQNQSVADEIEKLNKLYKEGVITKEEFEAQKKKLLQQ